MADKNDLMEQLSVAFGKKKAKKIIREVEKYKEQNPGEYFTFIFLEDGTFEAIPKLNS